ncbi:DUF2189 domain-containing protein [Sphingomonas hankyongi]|uniref:DUF2189 domain-containing protein n=1 Tax=Sphingomonas hankyongi TaxID=2908209 RepID=A0ABT0S3D9_9SPHN|nr:DUF2189 domain-containing protein [Sphingomonas hankyongi]MCL6730351.1 DUF2189 domain-containing protein [Sphingomonas hankyongi]
MATVHTSDNARAAGITVRRITDEDLRIALRQGLDDFLEMRGDLIFVGLIYPLIGVAAAVMTTSAPLLPFFLPVVAGVGLLGPVAAIGFYELARRRENGQHANWGHFLDVRKRPSADDIGIVFGLLLAIFALWLLAAGALYVAFFGWEGFTWLAHPTIGDFLRDIFMTSRGWALIASGIAVGALFGWLVLAISVASLPMLVDCDMTASEAVSASWRAAHSNMGVMIRWGLIVGALLVLGSIPLFVGLALVLPWLGYSTWHLYTRLVDRDAIPARNRRQD